MNCIACNSNVHNDCWAGACDCELCDSIEEVLEHQRIRLVQTRGGETAIATLADYASKGDSTSLAKLGEKPFTVIHVEDSDYTEGDNVTKGIKITTKETFDIDGEKVNKFHTTRVAIVSKFANQKLRDDINSGDALGPIKCVEEKTKNGKSFFNLVDAGGK